jgi:hypothetical protein
LRSEAIAIWLRATAERQFVTVFCSINAYAGLCSCSREAKMPSLVIVGYEFTVSTIYCLLLEKSLTDPVL